MVNPFLHHPPNANIAPYRNERFKFSAIPLTAKLLVLVKDHKTLGKDKLLGMAQVDVSSLRVSNHSIVLVDSLY